MPGPLRRPWRHDRSISAAPTGSPTLMVFWLAQDQLRGLSRGDVWGSAGFLRSSTTACSPGEFWPKRAFMRRSGSLRNDGAYSIRESSREQLAILPPFLRLSQCCCRDDAQGTRHVAGAGTTRRPPARTGSDGFGEDRSVARGTDASFASPDLQPGAPAQRRRAQSLICPIAELARPCIEPSRQKTSRGVRSVSGGSIEAIR